MNHAVSAPPRAPDELLDDMEQRGAEIYERQLKAALEADALGQMVAIHPESGEYAVARREEDAVNDLRARRPKGLLVLRRIGPPTSGDLRLAARLEGRSRGQ
jgi:hypothetical protein